MSDNHDLPETGSFDPRPVTDEQAQAAVQLWLGQRREQRRKYVILMVKFICIMIISDILLGVTHFWAYRLIALLAAACAAICIGAFFENREGRRVFSWRNKTK